ncbi:hypothetical protein EVAR_85306_1 [Eumeta japonica]|uniref:Integral membrane protein 2 n=1 Tax=Eumeta variegata TaxID=151549 RepID=A0A4C1V7Y0_EUMVA|nr:hypothetical protein EVAR_85306_1 [Eumeta japonica]
MTLFPKPPILNKLDITKSPLVKDSFGDEEKVEVYPSAPDWDRRRRASGLLLCIFVMALLVASVGVLGGVLLYRQYAIDTAVQRFQGFCSIPIDDNQEDMLIEPHFRVMPLSWSGEREPDAQLLGSMEGSRDSDLEHVLRELFQVDPDVERVLLASHNPPTSLIHDFKANASGCIDTPFGRYDTDTDIDTPRKFK